MARNTVPTLKHRVTLDLNGPAFDQLSELAKETANGQKATACRTAISIYHQLIEAQKDGKRIHLYDPTTQQNHRLILLGA